MSPFVLDLAPGCAQAVSEALMAYARTIDQREDEYVERLCEIGATTARQSCRSTDIAASIEVERRGEHTRLVVADDPNAAFVEFGTGVVGQGTYQGKLPPEWEYDQRRTPAAHDSKDPTRWYFYDENDRRRSTRGQRADGFMALAAEMMRQAAVPMAREVFER